MKRLLKRALRAAGLRKNAWERWTRTDPLEAVSLPHPRDLEGTLEVWSHTEGANRDDRPAEEPDVFRTTWIPGPDYRGMANNDLRGFLDGRFQYAWNQVSQAHVRLGRMDTWVKYGEYELFRVLHRWSDLGLPPGARVVGAELSLGVEAGPRVPLRVYAYRVRRDWTPGEGGVDRDNVSPPAVGEVWWNEAAHGQVPWGLPGAGYAALSEGADTDPEPLAEARYAPGDTVLEFDSPALASYCDEAVATGDAVRLLLKLSDVQEDVPGTLLTLYGADQGDDRTRVRRPRLTLEWTAPAVALLRRTLRVEHGRTLELPEITGIRPGWRWMSFHPREDSAEPHVEVWDGKRGPEVWRIAPRRPFEDDGTTLRLRVRAVRDPVAWGEPFEARFRDTWIRSAPPDAQRIPWRFTSPTGVTHDVLATYEGDATWVVSFVPDEVGPWRYQWSHELSETPYRSAEGAFDVVVDSRDQGIEALSALVARARRIDVRGRPVRGRRLLAAFSRLERAVLALETPESWRSHAAVPVRRLLDEAREALWGSPVPSALPMEPCRPPSWAGGAAAGKGSEEGEGADDAATPPPTPADRRP